MNTAAAVTSATTRTRKRGIEALLHDVTNFQDSPMPRRSTLQAQTAIKTQTERYAPRGNCMAGAKATFSKRRRATVAKKSPAQPMTLCVIAKKDQSNIKEDRDHLMAYIQRNTSYEVQKAATITIMATAITLWGCSIAEAATRAADCTGFYSETIRKWASSFFLSTTDVPLEDITDEYIGDLLCSNRGHHDNHTASLVQTEDFQLSARSFIREHACRKGEPNMTSSMFADWIESQYNTKVHNDTARRWLVQLGFTRVQHQKGVYFDGHDRDDVVLYRNKFLTTMEQLDKKSLTCDNTTPQLDEGEKPLIRVVHDESTYYANCDQSYFWGDDQTNVLRHKSLGASVMVSDFIDEIRGFVRDSEAEARVKLEIQRDGYFTNELLLKQVATTIDIFERVHPHAKGIFLFDNAPSHRKMADDSLNADKMNVGPGGKQPRMRDTVWGGAVQKMVAF